METSISEGFATLLGHVTSYIHTCSRHLISIPRKIQQGKREDSPNVKLFGYYFEHPGSACQDQEHVCNERDDASVPEDQVIVGQRGSEQQKDGEVGPLPEQDVCHCEYQGG